MPGGLEGRPASVDTRQWAAQWGGAGGETARDGRPGRRREAQRAAYGGRCGAGGREVAGPRREPGQMPGLAPPAHPGAVGVGGWERALGGPRSLWVLSPSPKGFEPRWAGRGPRTTPRTVDCWVPGMRGRAQPVLLERGPEPGLEGSCPQRGVASPRWGQGDTLQAPGRELFSTLYHLSVTSWPQSRGHSGYTAARRPPHRPRPPPSSPGGPMQRPGGRRQY